MKALRHRTARFLIVVALLWGGWEAFLAVSSTRRLDSSLTSAVERGGVLNIAVTLGFAPEDFHIRIFQGHGIVSGVRGTTVLLNRVSRDDLRRISRYYWVQRVAAQ